MHKGLRMLLIALLAPLLLAGCGDGKDDTKAGAKDKTPAATADQLVQSGLLLLKEGNQDAALQLFQQAAAKQPSNVYAHYNVGVILQQQNNRVEAVTAYRKALLAKPDYVPALYNSAVIYAASDPELAIETYRKVVKLQPKAPTAYLNLGLLEAAQGQEAQARKDLATAVEQDGSLAKKIPKDLFSKTTPTPTG